jgi:hypothetical protein
MLLAADEQPYDEVGVEVASLEVTHAALDGLPCRQLRGLRQAGSLILVFLVLVFGGSKHVGGRIIVAAEASTPLSAQIVGIGKFADSTNYQFMCRNSCKLIPTEFKSGLNSCAYSFSIWNDCWRDRSLNRVNARRFPTISRPQCHFSSDEPPSGICVSGVDYRKMNRDDVISEDRVYFELANGQSRTVGRDEFFFSTIDTTLELQSLPQKREELAYSDNRQSDRGPEQTAREESDAPIVRRFLVFALCLGGGSLLFIRGWDNFYKGRRLLGAAWILGGWFLALSGLGLWWLIAFPVTWGWPL